MATRMQQRRGTAAQWTAANPTLAAGEIGFETDTNQFKIGNGSSAWSALSYFKNLDGLDGVGGIVTLNANGVIDVNLIPQGVALDAELSQYVEDHSAETENVHGISNTEDLVYQDDLSGAISTEVTNRNTAITDAIVNEVSERNTAIGTALADEVTERNTAIDDAIALEVTNRNTAITDAITLEVSNRDEAIDDAIADEVTARNTAINDAITNEVTLRDAAIDDAIADEVTARNTAITADIGTHNSDTSNVHGILDTTVLATDSDVSAAQTAAEGYADSAVSAHNSDKTNVHGIANTDDLVLTNDARLSDERTPLDASITDAKINPATLLSQSSISGLTTDLAAKASLESPTFTGTVVLPATTAGGSIVPSTDNTYDLGSPLLMWKDIYVGPGSLYVNGQKVLQDESGNIVISADANENLSLRTSGSGNVELDATGTGNIQIKSAMVIEGGSNITSSDGNAIVFGNAINTDTISSKTTNTDLSLSANGTGKVYINDNAEVNGNFVVGGNLTVSGTTTTVNSETISLADNLIDLNSNFTSGTPTENSGVRIKRGDSADVQLRWNEGSDVWEFTNDGANYSTIAPLNSPTFTGTVSGITKSMVGLGNVDNTSDANKPISTATQTALDAKASTADLNSALLYSFNNETSSYTLVLSDATNMVEMESSSATTVTVPTNSSVAFPIGTTVDIFQKGTGQVTVAASGGVTIYATPGLKLRTQYSGATLIKRDTNTWILTGDLSA